MNIEMLEMMKNKKGFIAALDQSGGSSPKTLTNYGIEKDAYTTDEEMFELIHKMRQRVFSSDSFTSEHIIGAILFEKTMRAQVDGKYTSQYLWENKGILSFLKIDKGLENLDNGVKLMKPIPGLMDILMEAREMNIFGTKMRSVIIEPNEKGIRKIVEQQFDFAYTIFGEGLVPILEPEIDINAPEKGECERILLQEIKRYLKHWPKVANIIFKLTLPEIDNFYSKLYDYDSILKIVALSGGYSTDKSVELLEKNRGVIASFSRALLQDLRVNQTQEEFDKTLLDAIIKIYNASIT